MSKTYFEAYYADGGQVLGNLDGQGVHRGPCYQRTKHYRALKTGNERPRWPRIAFWLVVTERNHIRETIHNIHHASAQLGASR